MVTVRSCALATDANPTPRHSAAPNAAIVPMRMISPSGENMIRPEPGAIPALSARLAFAARDLPDLADLVEAAFARARTERNDVGVPDLLLQVLVPEGPGAALRRPRLVDRAALLPEEDALHLVGPLEDADAVLLLGVLVQERPAIDLQEGREPGDVLVVEEHPAIVAVRAAAIAALGAGEPQPVAVPGFHSLRQYTFAYSMPDRFHWVV